MASETKIKVKTPLVELDGDEVWVNSSYYSSKLSIGLFHKPAYPRAQRSVVVENAGKHGECYDCLCVNRTMTLLTALKLILDMY
jgi:hypothetical protein